MDRPNILDDVVRPTCRPEHRLGNGAYGTSYGLTHLPGLEPYTMRVAGGAVKDSRDPQEWLNELRYTTRLTPPRSLVGPVNLGQRLLETEESANLWPQPKPVLSFSLRQPGISIYEWMTRATKLHEMQGHDNPAVRAFMDVTDTILEAAKETGRNPFGPIWAMQNQLKSLDFSPQSDSGNIMWDEAERKLTMVDQTHWAPGTKFCSNLEDTFSPPLSAYVDCPASLLIAARQNSQAISKLIQQAKFSLPSVGLDTAKPVSNQGLALSDPPQALIERLRGLHAEIETGLA